MLVEIIQLLLFARVLSDIDNSLKNVLLNFFGHFGGIFAVPHIGFHVFDHFERVALVHEKSLSLEGILHLRCILADQGIKVGIISTTGHAFGPQNTP